MDLNQIESVIRRGPFEANWDSLKNYHVPDWYQDDKFGIFIHWGVYAVPAFGNEWYPRNMYQEGTKEFQHHVETYGPQTQFGYKDFIDRFKAEGYQPDDWAQIFRDAGAKFVVPVAEHHDGFAMYDTALSDWCASKMGPRRDLIGDLARSVREKGMVFGASSHRAEHWWFFDGGKKFPSDVQDAAFDGLYGPAQPEKSQPDDAFLNDWLLRTCEIVDKYRPQLIWFDWWVEQPVFQPYLQRFAAYYYNRGAEWDLGVAVNYKNESFPPDAAVLDIERGQLAGIRPLFWQTDTSVSRNSWGYVENQNYKSADELIGDLVDIVSKNGALLLNIGPRPDGVIPDPEIRLLREIGEWLKVNGEAVYNTRPWTVFGEGPTEIKSGGFTDSEQKIYTGLDFRFTTGGGNLYATALAWPGKEAVIQSLATGTPLGSTQVKDVQLLGSSARLKWTQDARGLVVTLPERPPSRVGASFRIIGVL